jgi:hydroxymethylpyrimidine/phosphomethylpyrimidine kinase
MSTHRLTPAAVLTIAGSDSSGGAGIQADLKTFAAFDVFGASAITAITAQNTCGVRAVHGVPPDMIAAQIHAVLDDVPIGAIKIGMVGSRAVAEAIATALRRFPDLPVVVDPVLIATSGDSLGDRDTPSALLSLLVPRATCLTPNLDEASMLTATPLARSERDMLEQGQALLLLGAEAVLLKGGHLDGDTCVDLLITDDGVLRFHAPRIAAHNTHGTGCTLSSAIAAGLAKGHTLAASVGTAKSYVAAGIAAGAVLNLGAGNGPLWHALPVPAPILPDRDLPL